MIHVHLTTIIGICAQSPRSGKDTLADYIEREAEAKDLRYFRIAFGDLLREVVSTLFGMDSRDYVMSALLGSMKDVAHGRYSIRNLENESLKEFLIGTLGLDPDEPRSPRFYMQRVGSDYVKGHLGLESMWVDAVDTQITTRLLYGNAPDLVIITDVRSPNEFDYVTERGFSVEVKTQGFPAVTHSAKPDTSHPVENHRFDCDFIFTNVYGDMQSLQYQLRESGLIDAVIERNEMLKQRVFEQEDYQ